MACMRPLHSKSIPWWPFTALLHLLARVIHKSPLLPRTIVWSGPEGHGTRQATLVEAGLERGHQVTPRPLITQLSSKHSAGTLSWRRDKPSMQDLSILSELCRLDQRVWWWIPNYFCLQAVREQWITPGFYLWSFNMPGWTPYSPLWPSSHSSPEYILQLGACEGHIMSL